MSTWSIKHEAPFCLLTFLSLQVLLECVLLLNIKFLK